MSRWTVPGFRVYVLHDELYGRKYYGITSTSVGHRLGAHTARLQARTHVNAAMQEVYCRDGDVWFVEQIAEYATKKEAKAHEDRLILADPTCYNVVGKAKP